MAIMAGVVGKRAPALTGIVYNLRIETDRKFRSFPTLRMINTRTYCCKNSKN